MDFFLGSLSPKSSMLFSVLLACKHLLVLKQIFGYNHSRQGCLCFGVVGLISAVQTWSHGADTWKKQALYHMDTITVCVLYRYGSCVHESAWPRLENGFSVLFSTQLFVHENVWLPLENGLLFKFSIPLCHSLYLLTWSMRVQRHSSTNSRPSGCCNPPRSQAESRVA